MKIPKSGGHFRIKVEFKAKHIKQRKGYFPQIESVACNEGASNHEHLEMNELHSIKL